MSSALSTIVAQRQVARQSAFQRADHGADLKAHQLLKQRFLVLEVQIDRALGDAGAARHVVEPRRGEAALGEFVERRLEDGGAALGRPGGAGIAPGRGGAIDRRGGPQVPPASRELWVRVRIF